STTESGASLYAPNGIVFANPRGSGGTLITGGPDANTRVEGGVSSGTNLTVENHGSGSVTQIDTVSAAWGVRIVNEEGTLEIGSIAGTSVTIINTGDSFTTDSVTSAVLTIENDAELAVSGIDVDGLILRNSGDAVVNGSADAVEIDNYPAGGLASNEITGTLLGTGRFVVGSDEDAYVGDFRDFSASGYTQYGIWSSGDWEHGSLAASGADGEIELHLSGDSTQLELVAEKKIILENDGVFSSSGDYHSEELVVTNGLNGSFRAAKLSADGALALENEGALWSVGELAGGTISLSGPGAFGRAKTTTAGTLSLDNGATLTLAAGSSVGVLDTDGLFVFSESAIVLGAFSATVDGAVFLLDDLDAAQPVVTIGGGTYGDGFFTVSGALESFVQNDYILVTGATGFDGAVAVDFGGGNVQNLTINSDGYTFAWNGQNYTSSLVAENGTLRLVTDAVSSYVAVKLNPAPPDGTRFVENGKVYTVGLNAFYSDANDDAAWTRGRNVVTNNGIINGELSTGDTQYRVGSLQYDSVGAFTFSGFDGRGIVTLLEVDGEKVRTVLSKTLNAGKTLSVSNVLFDRSKSYSFQVKSVSGDFVYDMSYVQNDVTDSGSKENYRKAGEIGVDEITTGFVGWRNGHDYYTFSVGAGDDPVIAGNYTFTLAGGSAKSTLVLYRTNPSSGKLVAVRRISGKTDGSNAGFSADLASGTYYLKVTSGDDGKGRYNTTYSLELDRNCIYNATTEDNNIFTSAVLEAGAGAESGYVGFADKQDFYRVDLGGATSMAGDLKLTAAAIGAGVRPGARVALYRRDLKSGALTTISRGTTDKNGTCTFNNVLLNDDADYYVKVSALSTGGSRNSNYELTLSQEAVDDYAIGETQRGSVSAADAEELYRFTAADSGKFRFDFEGDAKMKVAVYSLDTQGRSRRIAGYTTADRTFDLKLAAGVEYYTIVSLYKESSDYALKVGMLA
ncbi:MAG: hypothetical protein PHS41_09305, partial [Victivallaceae bacterium]|nr:hypothetical protein [Victivallaceae bacterium]